MRFGSTGSTPNSGFILLMPEQPKLVGALSVNVVGVILKVSVRFFEIRIKR